MKRNPILQGMMSPMHGRKSGMGDQEVFLLSTVPLSLICDQCIFHHFLCPLLHKSQDEVSFKGGLLHSSVTEILIKSLNMQLCHNVRANQVIEVWNLK
jgi:hypothetical protein